MSQRNCRANALLRTKLNRASINGMSAPATPALDDVSKGIIEQLQQDGRAPMPRSARRSGCPRPPFASGSSGCSTAA